MEQHLEQHLIFRIARIVRLEYVIVLLLLALGSWLFYFFFLRKLSEERHQIFRRLFQSLSTSVIIFIAAFSVHQAILAMKPIFGSVDDISLYSGFFCILMGSIVVIKTFKIIANSYFFYNSMRAGVPLLLVNVVSLFMYLLIFGWILTTLFEVQLTSILTTSAVLTIVLGLALQDTLGNLFAAISLQIDKPFELDDWIELRSGSAGGTTVDKGSSSGPSSGEKIAGQVKEMSWRATVLLAITDEYITIPNRTLAQWQIVNFSARTRPFYRGHVFRIPFGSSVEKAKAALMQAVGATSEILAHPLPLVIVTETTDSWVQIKVVYAIRNYGSQYIIADRFYMNALAHLEAVGIPLAASRLSLMQSDQA